MTRVIRVRAKTTRDTQKKEADFESWLISRFPGYTLETIHIVMRRAKDTYGNR